MTKRLSVLVAFTFVLLGLTAQNQDKEQMLNYSINPVNDWVTYSPANPTVKVVANNPTKEAVASIVTLDVMSDQYHYLNSFSQTVNLNAGDSTILDFGFTVPQPGFYRCLVKENDSIIKQFNIGYEPESIISLYDAQPDFKLFWDQAKSELAAVAPQFELTQITDDTNKSRKLYLVKMKSLGGEEISGYYSVPVKKGKYPAIISYMGYGSKPWIPGGTPGYAEFVLSSRGQGLNEPTNSYGDWITYNLDNKDEYYYRGAYMDLVRAIDFVASRPEVNTDLIFAEGGSQGGAFTLAAAALDNRLCAIAPTIPFLSDFQDYFKIVNWPAQPVLNKQKELGLSDNQMYTTLSYFDIKNLASWIECPVIMGVGLQDEVCPPHTNFSGYNRINSQKQSYIYPLNGHNTPESWYRTRMDFFENQIAKQNNNKR